MHNFKCVFSISFDFGIYDVPNLRMRGINDDDVNGKNYLDKFAYHSRLLCLCLFFPCFLVLPESEIYFCAMQLKTPERNEKKHKNRFQSYKNNCEFQRSKIANHWKFPPVAETPYKIACCFNGPVCKYIFLYF